MPLSTTLAASMVDQLELASMGKYESPELKRVRPLLELQQQWSALPTPQTLLAEVLTSRDGTHLFLYPFAGRHVHLGLASLLAWRAAQIAPRTFSIAVNDYGFELLCAEPVDWSNMLAALINRAQPAMLLDEVLASLNASELAQRRFREIARVAGLVFGGYPGAPKSLRQLQASSSLFFEVFRKYDAGNRLLGQAESEVLSQELELTRLAQTLAKLAALPQTRVKLAAASPFALPLMVERLREQFSTEKLKDRLDRLLAASEAVLAAPVGKRRRADGDLQF